MDQAMMARLRPRLEQRAAELRTAIAAGEKADVPIAPDKAIGRLTRVDAMQSQQMASALTGRNREELARIERALNRIETGDYGICGRCGEDIAEARLEAVPDAVLCRTCADRPKER